MVAPTREETGRLVTEASFELPDAYPSGADYSICSQFDDVPGPYRPGSKWRSRTAYGTRERNTFGGSAREDHASYLRSIGGGGQRATPTGNSWCSITPGPERYEDAHGWTPVNQPSCVALPEKRKALSDKATLQATLRALGERTWPSATVGSVVVELSSREATYSQKGMTQQTSAKSGWARDRSQRFSRDREDRRFGKYEHPGKFAVQTFVTGANATHGCKIGKGKRVSFLRDAKASHDHFQDSDRATVAKDCATWRAGTPGAKKRPGFGNGTPRECIIPMSMPRRKPKPVFRNASLDKILMETKPLRRRKDGSVPAERDLDADYAEDLERRWWPNQKPGSLWPPAKNRPAGRKTKIRQRQFGKQERPALMDAMRVAGRLKCSEGPGPCVYDPKYPARPTALDEAQRSFNIHLRVTTAPSAIGRARVEVPDAMPPSVRRLPPPPDWKVWQSPVAKRLSATRDERRRVRTAAAKTRAEAAAASRPSTSAAIYRIKSPLASKRTSRASISSRSTAPEAAAPGPADSEDYSEDEASDGGSGPAGAVGADAEEEYSEDED